MEKHRIHLGLLGLYNFCSQFRLILFYFSFFVINISFKKTDNQERQQYLPQSRKENRLYSKCIKLRNKLKWKVRLGQWAGNISSENTIYERFFSRIGTIVMTRSALFLKVFFLPFKTYITEQTNLRSVWKSLKLFTSKLLYTKVIWHWFCCLILNLS